MNFRIQLIAVTEEGEEQIQEVLAFEREVALRSETLGLTLAESKNMLKQLQEQIVEHQVNAFMTTQQQCIHCGKHLSPKGSHVLALRSVFGKLKIRSPRLRPCQCQPLGKSLSPVALALPERTTPELLFLETKWASLISYGATENLMRDTLPMDEKLNQTTIRNHIRRAAHRVDQELGEESANFMEGSQCQRDALPIPNGPLVVGLDGGYVRGRKGSCFEIIAGKSILTFQRENPEQKPSSKCFAFVQTYDEKPKRRLFEMLKSQGYQQNQSITFLSDGGEDIRQLPRYLSPEAEHFLDWFHIAMRLTVLKQTAKGLPLKVGEPDDEFDLQAPTIKILDSIHWYLWHGNVYQALEHVDELQEDMDCASLLSTDQVVKKMCKTVDELHTYIRRNHQSIPNYGERYRQGDAISTSFVESTVNQVVSKRFAKKQQMRWTPQGAHHLLQVRTRVLNKDWEQTLRSWYPMFRPENQKAA